MYYVKVKKISVENESGDQVVVVTCYLVDGNGITFKSTNNEVDTFTIRAPKTSVPPSNILTYLEGLAYTQISYKYSKSLTATGSHGSSVLQLSESDLKNVRIGHLVSGPGISTTLSVTSIKSVSEAILSGTLTLQYTGNTTAPSFTKTGNVVSGSNVISGMSSTTSIVGGMVVSGYGIPSGTTVLAVNSLTEIVVTQNALSSTTGATLTFSTDAESAYVDTISPAILTTAYEGLIIEGTTIPRDTVIEQTVSTSRLKLQGVTATAASTGATYLISGSPSYYFDVSGWTIDYTSLQKVIDVIDFTEL
jgi:hypothetical protein